MKLLFGLMVLFCLYSVGLERVFGWLDGFDRELKAAYHRAQPLMDVPSRTIDESKPAPPRPKLRRLAPLPQDSLERL